MILNIFSQASFYKRRVTPCCGEPGGIPAKGEAHLSQVARYSTIQRTRLRQKPDTPSQYPDFLLPTDTVTGFCRKLYILTKIMHIF